MKPVVEIQLATGYFIFLNVMNAISKGQLSDKLTLVVNAKTPPRLSLISSDIEHFLEGVLIHSTL